MSPAVTLTGYLSYAFKPWPFLSVPMSSDNAHFRPQNSIDHRATAGWQYRAVNYLFFFVDYPHQPTEHHGVSIEHPRTVFRHSNLGCTRLCSARRPNSERTANSTHRQTKQINATFSRTILSHVFRGSNIRRLFATVLRKSPRKAYAGPSGPGEREVRKQ